VSLLPDYSRQALTYDSTRAASPSVLGPLSSALSGAPGKRLVDIGGGTGNYAAALALDGWQPLVVDRSPEMLERARDKGLETIEADAQRLPLEDESVDAAILVSMLHHVQSPALALAEARRILRPGGRIAVMAFTREDIEDLWLLDFFPSSREWMLATHPSLAALLEQLPGAELVPLVYEDIEDASLAAMASRPEMLLESSQREQTSYFERMARDHPAELEAGLRRLRAQIDSGSPPRRAGRASVLAWVKDRRPR
jgi:ubiquinone/menaquinone biosynthesis C-methylase UbiE